MFNITQVARIAAGQTQTEFAEGAGITQPDLCEMEGSVAPYGLMGKYRKVSDYTGIPVDALLRNDFLQFPLKFFGRFPAPNYREVPNSTDARLGRAGEELIYQREQARLSANFPALSRLVLPYYKLRTRYPGFDILSFDDDGQPFAIEVKTSELDLNGFRISANELKTAEKLAASGGRYCVVCITNFGKLDQRIEEYFYDTLLEKFNIYPTGYRCQPKPPARAISGLAYHRQRLGLTQTELAAQLGVMPCNISSTENGSRGLIAAQYLKASNILGVPVDDLLRTYVMSDLLEADHEPA